MLVPVHLPFIRPWNGFLLGTDEVHFWSGMYQLRDLLWLECEFNLLWSGFFLVPWLGLSHCHLWFLIYYYPVFICKYLSLGCFLWLYVIIFCYWNFRKQVGSHPITSVAWLPMLRLLVTLSKDGNLHVWETRVAVNPNGPPTQANFFEPAGWLYWLLLPLPWIPDDFLLVLNFDSLF